MEQIFSMVTPAFAHQLTPRIFLCHLLITSLFPLLSFLNSPLSPERALAQACLALLYNQEPRLQHWVLCCCDCLHPPVLPSVKQILWRSLLPRVTASFCWQSAVLSFDLSAICLSVQGVPGTTGSLWLSRWGEKKKQKKTSAEDRRWLAEI